MEASNGDFIIQLIPILVLWSAFAVFGYFIARRKGVGIGTFALGIFPLWSGLFVIYWASLPDKSLLERLEQLEARR